MSKNYYKDAFAVDEISYNKRKLEVDFVSEPFMLNNYDYYEPKLESDFYIKYFTKELLLEVDILDFHDLLQYHFENCANTDLLLSILKLKILPKASEMIENGKASPLEWGGYYNEIALEDGFVQTEGVIKNANYEYGMMLHVVGFRSLQNDLQKRTELIFSFLNNLNTNKNEDNLEWIGKPTHIAYIISCLVQEGYVSAPLQPNGEINYTELSRQILNSFSFNKKTPSIDSLRRYANQNSDKFHTLNEKFESEDFNLPDSKILS
ncbi:hypothetical protein ACW5R3_03840 [Bizionia sp. KMM 8389]